MLVVTVLFVVKSESLAEFQQAIWQNAATSLREEAGCHQFDVCFSPDKPHCFLYELYSDAAAFDLHLAAPHFHEFNRLTEAMVTSKIVHRYELLSNPFI